MFQFADVSWPWIFEQLTAGLLVYFYWSLIVEVGEFLHKLLSKRYYILFALAQWRQMKADGVHAIEQILAKRAFLHHLLQVAVGGGNEADVYRNLLCAAYSCHGPSLQGCEQFGLERIREVAYLVHEECAALGQFHLSRFVALGVGECPSYISEQLTLK